MTLWYCNSLFCLRPSKKYCTNNTEILGVREIKDSIESMWLESFNLCIQKSMHLFNLNVRSPLSNLVYICLTEVNEKLSPIYFLLLEKKKITKHNCWSVLIHDINMNVMNEGKNMSTMMNNNREGMMGMDKGGMDMPMMHV